jgi:hypothetical protein
MPFITTFWCAPPLAQFDDQRAAEIAGAGFSIVGAPCEGPFDPAAQLKALDVAARHGLKMWVADPRFNERARAVPDWEEQMAAAVDLYRGHEALGGYFVTDEPTADQFDNLAVVVETLQALDPDHIAYINLLADYVPGLGTSSYREYVERFVSTVHPQILSYDYYPFTVDGDRRTFFDNLAVIRAVALRHDLPFVLIVLAMPHAVYRDPTEAELSWQALHALAYGAKGISYFAYWTPVDVPFQDVMKFRHGLIEGGAATEHYGQAARLNRVITGLAREMEPFHSVRVADSTGRSGPSLPVGPIAGVAGGRATIGVFQDPSGRRVVLLANHDYRRGATLSLAFASGDRLTERYEPLTRVWRTLPDATVTLPAGGGVLLR